MFDRWVKLEREGNGDLVNLLNQENLNSMGNTSITKQTVTNNDPGIVVSNYMQNTLGTIPNAKIDYESAKKYLSSSLKKQFKTPAFVPQSYCIQDGPNNVKINSLYEKVNMIEFDVVPKNQTYL